jgi:hypothetical protein
MKTRTDLIHRALRNLGALPVGQTPSVEESTLIDDLIDPMFEELSAREILDYGLDTDNIEEKHFGSLGHILAWRAATEFGQGQDAALAALNQRAEMDLKDMSNIIDRFKHMRKMRSDYPVRRCVSTNLSNCST